MGYWEQIGQENKEREGWSPFRRNLEEAKVRFLLLAPVVIIALVLLASRYHWLDRILPAW